MELVVKSAGWGGRTTLDVYIVVWGSSLLLVLNVVGGGFFGYYLAVQNGG